MLDGPNCCDNRKRCQDKNQKFIMSREFNDFFDPSALPKLRRRFLVIHGACPAFRLRRSYSQARL